MPSPRLTPCATLSSEPAMRLLFRIAAGDADRLHQRHASSPPASPWRARTAPSRPCAAHRRAAAPSGGMRPTRAGPPWSGCRCASAMIRSDQADDDHPPVGLHELAGLQHDLRRAAGSSCANPRRRRRSAAPRRSAGQMTDAEAHARPAAPDRSCEEMM